MHASLKEEMKFLPEKKSECEFNCVRILKIHSTAFYSSYEVQKGLVVKGKKSDFAVINKDKNSYIELLLMELGVIVKNEGKRYCR